MDRPNPRRSVSTRLSWGRCHLGRWPSGSGVMVTRWRTQRGPEPLEGTPERRSPVSDAIGLDELVRVSSGG